MASTYLSRTPGSASNRQIFTFSFWIKRSRLGYEQYLYCTSPSNAQTQIIFSGGDVFGFDHYTTGYTTQVRSTQVFRDVSAWYHLMVAVDTTQATASNRVKLYVNGSQITDLSSSTYPSQNFDYSVNNTVVQNIGRWIAGPDNYYDGCLSNYYLIDGQALTPSSFGQTDATTGIWKPKSYSGSYGTNGFFLKFENSGSLGTDSSGNGNNWTVNGTPTQTLDTPSNVFAAFNSIVAPYSAPTLSNGNLVVTNSGAFWQGAFGTLAVSKSKWYWEAKCTDATYSFNHGVFDVDANSFSVENPMNVSTGYTGFYNTSGGQMRKDNATSGSYGTFANGDIMGIALNMDDKQISIYKNGSSHVSNFALSTGCLNVVPCMVTYQTGAWQYNFGNGVFGSTAISSPYSDGAGLGKFQYQPPTGYYALCTKNINTYG